MNFHEMAERVDSKESFLKFVQALAEDAKLAENQKLNPSPNGWENGSISSFLGAISAWSSSISGLNGQPFIGDEPTWRAFAELLLSGKFYE